MYFKELIKIAFENNSVNIVTFRKILLIVFNLSISFMFFVFAVVFYLDGSYKIVYLKLFFFILTILVFLYYKKRYNYNSYSNILVIIATVYAVLVFNAKEEAHLGFIWIMAISVSSVFVLGYKRASVFLSIFIVLFFFMGIYDVLYINNQFYNFISFSLFFLTTILLTIFSLFIDYTFFQMNNMVVKISETDYLTNIHNRRKIDEVLEYEIQNHHSLSVAILDIDNFKNINDRYGHLVGDKVLKIFADTLSKSIRKTDILGRWGGEEFIIVLPNTEIKDTIQCMNKIKENISKLKIDEIEHRITCSFGVASSLDNTTLDKLILKADNALYEAKEKGKDRIIVAT